MTLIQTGKAQNFPVVLIDTDYWGEMIDWIKGEMLPDGMISPEDLDLLHVTDDLDYAVQTVLECYERNCAEDAGRSAQGGRAVAPYTLVVRLRDLPSVDELARTSDDPLAVEAARIVLARAREEIQAGLRSGRPPGAAGG